MKMTVTEHDFHRAFDEAGRGNNFSYRARMALYDYLTDLEEDTGEDIELDIIALCCEYSEYESAIDAAKEYGQVCYDENAAAEWLRDRTYVIEFDGGVIIQDF